MTDLHEQTTEAIRVVLAEHGAASPSHDTDTLAGLCATAAVQAAREHAAANADPAAELAAADVPEDDQPG